MHRGAHAFLQRAVILRLEYDTKTCGGWLLVDEHALDHLAILDSHIMYATLLCIFLVHIIRLIYCLASGPSS